MSSLATTLSVTTPSDLEIVIERLFNAPQDLVFDCYTKPALLRRWLTGSAGWQLLTCDVDLRVGGTYRYVWSGPNGETMGMNGQFHEVVPVDRIVSTEQFDDDFGMGKMLVTIGLVPEGERTRMHQTLLYESKGQRDAAVATGMTEGMGESFASLDALLADLAR